LVLYNLGNIEDKNALVVYYGKKKYGDGRVSVGDIACFDTSKPNTPLYLPNEILVNYGTVKGRDMLLYCGGGKSSTGYACSSKNSDSDRNELHKKEGNMFSVLMQETITEKGGKALQNKKVRCYIQDATSNKTIVALEATYPDLGYSSDSPSKGSSGESAASAPTQEETQPSASSTPKKKRAGLKGFKNKLKRKLKF
jgi:hypothetical protein